jgi:uncharacterized protein (TIGR02271 family)
MSELTQKKVIPLIEEEVVVEKRSVDVGGVRITKHVREQEKIIDELLRKERISVERRPVNQRVEVAPRVRREGDTLIIPLVEEVLVTEKRLVLKEELRLTLERTEERKPQTVILRGEEATVERLDPSGRKE